LKNKKGLIAALCAIVLIVSFAACAKSAKTQNVTQLVTDANGNAVTDADGNYLTQEVEAQLVTDTNGKTVTEVVTDAEGKELTTIVDNKYVKVTQAVTVAQDNNGENKTSAGSSNSKKADSTSKKSSDSTTKKSESTTEKPKGAPDAPKNVSSLSTSDVGEKSVKLSWSKVSCSGYQIAISKDSGATWSYLEKEYTKTTYTAKDLTSNTSYKFRVRAYNKNKVGTAESKWKEVSVKTKANKDPRKIEISITLPLDGHEEDTLIVKIDDKEIKKTKVTLDGSIYVFTTEEKYKGEVKVYAELENHGSDSVNTDKKKCTLELPLTRIPILIDDED